MRKKEETGLTLNKAGRETETDTTQIVKMEEEKEEKEKENGSQAAKQVFIDLPPPSTDLYFLDIVFHPSSSSTFIFSLPFQYKNPGLYNKLYYKKYYDKYGNK